MLQQLPAELLQAILQLLGDYDLCRVSTLCRSLHVLSLSELFFRNGSFTPATPSLSKPAPRSAIKSFLPSHGTCITLTKEDNIPVLLGLRHALPHLFNQPGQITALLCSFNGPLPQFYKELQALSGFFVEGLLASTIEIIVLDFHHAPTGSILDDDWNTPYNDPDPEGVRIIKEFLSIFCGETKLRRSVSLSILNGATKVDVLREIDHYLRRRFDSQAISMNVMNTLASIASNPLSSLFQSKFWSKSLLGLHAINIHTNFVLHISLCFTTARIFQQHSTSLRSISFHNDDILDIHWTIFSSDISLPNLEELYLGQSPITLDTLISFLIRHRSLKILDLGSNVRIWDDIPKRPPFFLPNLTTFKGATNSLPFFLLPYGGTQSSLSALRFITLIVPAKDWDFHFEMEEAIRLASYSTQSNALTLTLRKLAWEVPSAFFSGDFGVRADEC
ncbi:hypothetical protein AX16_005680 [Volvariella volvacea WC 439]|nr:hypothetical protein AX16_005680 [Volvariella volvacea WC 439]